MAPYVRYVRHGSKTPIDAICYFSCSIAHSEDVQQPAEVCAVLRRPPLQQQRLQLRAVVGRRHEALEQRATVRANWNGGRERKVIGNVIGILSYITWGGEPSHPGNIFEWSAFDFDPPTHTHNSRPPSGTRPVLMFGLSRSDMSKCRDNFEASFVNSYTPIHEPNVRFCFSPPSN